MSKDISRILEGWEFDPEHVVARIIQGEDGQEKIQLRIDLGLLQMEMSGRPDGKRPEGFESWLEVYEDRQSAHDAAHPDGPPFQLSDADCGQLWQEGVQFYHRYLSLWHLERYDLCARDTQRNLRLFEFVRKFARNDRARLQFDQWRPYVAMMHTRSVATPLVKEEKFAEALQAIEGGIASIRDFLDEHGLTQRADECEELASLERWRERLLTDSKVAVTAGPEQAIEVLRRQLQEAISAENFEEAARLRDEIHRLST